MILVVIVMIEMEQQAPYVLEIPRFVQRNYDLGIIVDQDILPHVPIHVKLPIAEME